MSTFEKITKKIKKQYKIKHTNRRCKPYNERINICPKLDVSGAMLLKCTDDEWLQCILCLQQSDTNYETTSRSTMVKHIRKTHQPDCPNCKISFKSWKEVSEHQDFCIWRPRLVDQRWPRFPMLNIVLKRSADDWSFDSASEASTEL